MHLEHQRVSAEDRGYRHCKPLRVHLELKSSLGRGLLCVHCNPLLGASGTSHRPPFTPGGQRLQSHHGASGTIRGFCVRTVKRWGASGTVRARSSWSMALALQPQKGTSGILIVFDPHLQPEAANPQGCIWKTELCFHGDNDLLATILRGASGTEPPTKPVGVGVQAAILQRCGWNSIRRPPFKPPSALQTHTGASGTGSTGFRQ